MVSHGSIELRRAHVGHHLLARRLMRLRLMSIILRHTMRRGGAGGAHGLLRLLRLGRLCLWRLLLRVLRRGRRVGILRSMLSNNWLLAVRWVVDGRCRHVRDDVMAVLGGHAWCHSADIVPRVGAGTGRRLGCVAALRMVRVAWEGAIGNRR